MPFAKHVADDQKQFWTEPTRFRVRDLKWAVPFVGVTAGFIASDQWWSKQVPNEPNELTRSLHISEYTTYAMIGAGGGAFILGQITNSDHMKEAGLLSGEAAINSTGVAYLFKEITQRQRPLEGNGNGDFFSGGASFPSEHSAIAWSIASVMAHEYPSPLVQFAAYSAATVVTVTRVTARQHFPSDVIVGSALGWYFGRQVYRKHHDPEIGGGAWGDWFDDKHESGTRNPNYMASPYVPLDSWVYPAFEQLIALGYVRSNILGMRPWTRLACARLLDDVQDQISVGSAELGGAERTYSALRDEFGMETERLNGAANLGASVDSVYTRSMGISGTPLRDSFNFGQTVTNDYGRPYWTGYNNITGITAQAEAGPLAVNIDAEYQHSPAMPSYSSSTLAAVAVANLRPPLANGIGQIDQVKLLNSTVSLNVDNLQFTFGEQSAWLGPGESSSFLMSNNAAPFPMLKIDDVVTHELPGPLKFLGPFRTEFFIGQLSGHHWENCIESSCQTYPGYPTVVGPDIVPQPFIQGDKISFQPTPNFEFGMGFTAMFGGPGLPVTFGNFFRTYFAHSSTAANNPGKRISQADFTYRIPGFRNWLTFYLDSLVTDEVSPIGSTRANVNPGIYMPRVPKVPKLQLRAEGINESRTNEFSPGFVYSDNRRFLDGYSNNGQLMGSAFGRAGRGGQAWLSYWLSPRNRIQLSYRLQDVSPRFIEGGRMADYSVQSEFSLGTGFALSGMIQYEQWKFPALNQTPQSDVTVSFQLIFYPQWHLR
ncbi:MAG: capsule assembly Wzi family protein [Terriglobales bacterium]